MEDDARTVDALTRDWKIVQRAAGHRHSIDDVLTAHYALRFAPDATTALDLGTGIGTVGLLVLWGLGERAHLTAIEAQPISHALLLENIETNGLGHRVTPLLGDLRELARPERFPLVTGSPPYFPVGTGVLPSDSQKAHARFELRGDVADYARTAARHVDDRGTFAFCFPTPQRSRALDAARAAGFTDLTHQDVIPREGLAPLFTLFAARRGPAREEIEPPLVVRHADGARTAAMNDVRARFGFTASSW